MPITRSRRTKNETNEQGGHYHGSCIEGKPSTCTSTVKSTSNGRLGTGHDYSRSALEVKTKEEMTTTTIDTRDNINVRPGIEFEPGRVEVRGYSQQNKEYILQHKEKKKNKIKIYYMVLCTEYMCDVYRYQPWADAGRSNLGLVI